MSEAVACPQHQETDRAPQNSCSMGSLSKDRKVRIESDLLALLGTALGERRG